MKPDCTDQDRRPQGGPGRAAIAVVLTTEADETRAEALARALLERRLVGCVSMLPVRSFYRWQGQLEATREVKLLLKSSAAHLDSLHAALLELHSYETPEWIVLDGSSRGGYGDWLAAQLETPLRERAPEPCDPISPGAVPPAP